MPPAMCPSAGKILHLHVLYVISIKKHPTLYYFKSILTKHLGELVSPPSSDCLHLSQSLQFISLHFKDNFLLFYNIIKASSEFSHFDSAKRSESPLDQSPWGENSHVFASQYSGASPLWPLWSLTSSLCFRIRKQSTNPLHSWGSLVFLRCSIIIMLSCAFNYLLLLRNFSFILLHQSSRGNLS